ncbi:hypothetical protein M514_25695 [Trichuris suis]|uniref:DUF7083 domain-containing protein n=1 Tax=Trichuris suis TaxID=68888 RepID=A0A085MWC0_9BILA|nr:hypothetical protein M514_26329 [Trichuris suis]KFD62093.1 hypothetical protein M514_25695 [Trichuris suis]
MSKNIADVQALLQQQQQMQVLPEAYGKLLPWAAQVEQPSLDSLSASIAEFVYEPADGLTFDAWFTPAILNLLSAGPPLEGVLRLDNDSPRSPLVATSILFLDFVKAAALLNPHSTKYVEGNAMKKVYTFVSISYGVTDAKKYKKYDSEGRYVWRIGINSPLSDLSNCAWPNKASRPPESFLSLREILNFWPPDTLPAALGGPRPHVENGWFTQFQEVFTIDCAALDDKAKVRFLLRKVSTPVQDKYRNFILPKKPCDFDFYQTVACLRQLFG